MKKEVDVLFCQFGKLSNGHEGNAPSGQLLLDERTKKRCQLQSCFSVPRVYTVSMSIDTGESGRDAWAFTPTIANFSLTKKVAIVTGAAKGNGATIADALVQAGAVVCRVDKISHSVLKDDQFIVADLTKGGVIQRLVDKVVKENGRIDILVNNAGISIGGYDKNVWDDTMLINLKVPFLLSKEAMPHMTEGGSIINITSLGAHQGFSNNPSYIASKGGLSQLTKAFAMDWAKLGIRVNNIVPGYRGCPGGC